VRCRLLASLLFFVVVACSGCGDAKRTVRVPNLVGVSHGAALERLEHAGLCVGLIKLALAGRGPYDEVVDQQPRAGTAAVAHTAVTLTLTPNGPNGGIYSDDLTGCPPSIGWDG
jgi:beta-lactam-binding protein with PASTA domain